MPPGHRLPTMYRALKNGILEWIFQWRGPERGIIVLVQRHVFILPTPQGVLFATVIVLMLVGSVNYDLSLGFILAFLLGATGIQSMLHTFRNLAHLRISPGRTQPAFAGEQAHFQVNIANTTRAARYSIGVTRDNQTADYVDVPADGEVAATVRVPAVRRGWLRPGRLTLFTRFPVGLFRAWSYADPDVSCLVYPAPASPGLALPLPEAGAGDGGIHGQGYDEFSGLRPYRPGDSPRHIAWKAVARDATLLTKQFAGRADAELWLAWEALPQAMDTERRLAHLVRWVLDADTKGLAYGLRLPGNTIAIAAGTAHRAECLRALALYGIAANQA
jgi:uncharacterized protein (DUF58 family)